MKTYTASYIFPDDFLWGIVPDESFLTNKDSYSSIYGLKEKRVGSVLIDVPWDKCEPLKGSFDEPFLETVRTLLARIRGENIEPFVILNTGKVPGWQNLEKNTDADPGDVYNFSIHIADALVPYTNFFGSYCPKGSLFSRNLLNEKLSVLSDIRGHIHSLSESAKCGIVLSEVFREKSRLFMQLRYDFLKKIETDFFGLPASDAMTGRLTEIFGEERRPIIFINDGLKSISAAERPEILTDKLYKVWHFYQKGWPVIGYFSETEPGSGSPDASLYEFFSKKNAFEISTDMDGLPEKWKLFLKD